MENAPSLILGIALVVLLLLIAFSSGTEVAMLSANRYKIRAAAKAGGRNRVEVAPRLHPEPARPSGGAQVIRLRP